MTNEDVIPEIGINMGIRYSCVGVWLENHHRVEIMPNRAGNRSTPSYVAFTPTGCLIGEDAKNQITTNPANTIYDLQKLVGRRFDDPEVQEGMKSWPFKVIKGTNGLPKIVVTYKGKEKEYSPEEISWLLLEELKNLAESFLGRTVKDAIITVPAYFNASQRQATKRAAHLAGLDVLKIINEPSAALIAYGLHVTSKETNVLIFDSDDDTFHVSLVTINKDMVMLKAHSGDQGILKIVVDRFVNEFNRKHEVDLNKNLRALGRLRTHFERTIQDLSSHKETTIYVECLHQDIDFYTTITRGKFEYLIRSSFFNNCKEAVASCLRDAKINKTDVDDIILVGRSIMIPKVQEFLREYFNEKEILDGIHVEEVVASGAIVAAAKYGSEKREKAKNIPLLDVVPLSLGVNAHDGVFSVIIPRNTPIPTEKENIYFTTSDNQDSLCFNVYQGERSKAKDNNCLGEFKVVVSPAPKGKSKVRVVFSVDTDGTLKCWVKEFTTGLKKKIMIDNDKLKHSEEEIEEMLDDAEWNKFKDMKYKRIMCARNVLEEYIYNVKRKMKTIGSSDKTELHAEEIKIMEDAIEAASQHIDGNLEHADIDDYQKVLNQLEKLCVSVISQLV